MVGSSRTSVTALSGGDEAYNVGSPLCRCVCIASFDLEACAVQSF